ncbi:four helix bundle protein [Candidatus Falkowbacteria bacterium]|nr:four helix bundle protein [Candidatus Falkowbacteria bacterium]
MPYIKYSFEKLEIYELAQELVLGVYNITEKFPREEIYALTSQVRRAAVSVVLNIVEGSIGRSRKDFARFVGQSIGSLVEVKAGLILAGRLKYITQSDFLEILPLIDKLFFKSISFKKSLL